MAVMDTMSEREKIVLAALAAEATATYTPVQVQKLLFLVEKRIPDLGGPFFDFAPYDYGPFDSEVYSSLEQLAHQGYIDVINEPGLRWKKYRLTPKGEKRGHELLSEFGEPTGQAIRELNKFVRSMPFAQLVSSIYKAYPDMKRNSVFNG